MSGRFTIWRASFWLFICMFSGFVVAVLSYMALLHAATHLLGGSLSIGAFTGYYAAKRYGLRSGSALMTILGCACAGVIGWLCALPLMH